MFKARVPFAPYFYIRVAVRLPITRKIGHEQAQQAAPSRTRRVTAALPGGVCSCLVCWAAQEGREAEAEAWLRRKGEGSVRSVEVVTREDLDLVRGSEGCWLTAFVLVAWCCVGAAIHIGSG